MSKEQLWSDKKIEDVSAPGVIAGNGGRFVNLAIVTDMRNDYERALAFRNEDIGKLNQALKTLRDQNIQIADNLERVMRERDGAQARIAELEAHLAQTEAILANTQRQRDDAYAERAAAQQWLQLIANEEHIQEDKIVLIENQGQWVGIKRGDVVFGAWLDVFGCAIFRKIQLAK